MTKAPKGFCCCGLNNKLLVHYVHSNFETETHFSSSWFSPHSISPSKLLKSTTTCLVVISTYTYSNWKTPVLTYVKPLMISSYFHYLTCTLTAKAKTIVDSTQCFYIFKHYICSSQTIQLIY